MKRIFNRFFCGIIACITLFCGASCFLKKETIKCAPCTVWEIWNYTEEVYEEFFYLKMIEFYTNGTILKCTVNGEDWSRMRMIDEELEEGEYTIEFWTEKDFMIEVASEENGQMVREQVPYEKELTLYVDVSANYENIFDCEYRKANGLWINASTQPWYQTYLDAWQEDYEKNKQRIEW